MHNTRRILAGYPADETPYYTYNEPATNARMLQHPSLEGLIPKHANKIKNFLKHIFVQKIKMETLPTQLIIFSNIYLTCKLYSLSLRLK